MSQVVVSSCTDSFTLCACCLFNLCDVCVAFLCSACLVCALDFVNQQVAALRLANPPGIRNAVSTIESR